jgi:hypothetical protein
MALTQVQAPVYGSGTTSALASFASTPTQGNLLIAYAGTGSETMAGAAISGFTLLIAVKSNTDRGLGIYYKVAGAAESKDVTLTGTSPCRLAIEEWSGLNAVESDKTASTPDSGSTVTSRSSGTTATTTAPDELAVAMLAPGGSTTGQSWSNGFTQSYGSNNYFTGYKVLTSMGAVETTLSWTTARNCGGCIATFKAGMAPRANYLHARRDRMNTKGVSLQDFLA